MEKDEKIKVAITHGDVNGIGYEVIIKTLLDPKIMELCTSVVYGSSKVASYHKKTITESGDFAFNLIKTADLANSKRCNIINCYDKEVKIELGKSTELAGMLSLMSIDAAIHDLKNKLVDVLVTAPINKKNIQSEDFNFPGHTEYLAEKFGSKEYLMLMVSDRIKIGVVTGHVPLRDVSKNINEDTILKKLRVMNNSLKRDFAILRPQIAVLGLNPHAGDEGILGNEETKFIIPAIKKAFDEGILAFGPYPSDGFFGSSAFSKFDGILAMYHDQGMIPFKTLAFEGGVNFTAGLPIVRTSPAHGTAYEIAGKNIASADSFREAIYTACDIHRNRLMWDELHSNQLPFTVLDSE